MRFQNNLPILTRIGRTSQNFCIFIKDTKNSTLQPQKVALLSNLPCILFESGNCFSWAYKFSGQDEKKFYLRSAAKLEIQYLFIVLSDQRKGLILDIFSTRVLSLIRKISHNHHL